ncbi:Apolipoprotein D [Harpegnathos saltator]|uniref:Apolipoprotein D n=1 Tax=Harpegnathos saltator TaxID=610380 RepID=E2BV02_HARSA|nr:Apolipoprotein D [Harpegnathos saltator]
MFAKVVLALSLLACASAQIPNLGFCPEYVPMANFDLKRFMGVWYESERYFQLSEVVSRCVMTNYTRGADGKYRVSNQVTNRFTGIKRILEGEIKPAASKAEEGKLLVRYTIPLAPETKYSVLETDYDSYAVLWSCQGIGPVHAQNAWVMTRQRIPPGEVLQKAYGVLDKYKISKTFFVKTDQADCAYLDTPATEKPPKKKPEQTSEESGDARSAVALGAVDDEVNLLGKADVSEDKAAPSTSDIPKIIAEAAKPLAIPERILKIAEAIKEESADAGDKMIIVEVKEEKAADSAQDERSERAQETEKTA